MTTPTFKFALRDDLQDDKQFLPTRGEPKASGWDVRAAMKDKRTLIVKPFDLVKIPLGVRAFCPEGWWYDIKPRSSTFVKKNLHALYGTIDETYEGELVFACQYLPPVTYKEVWDEGDASDSSWYEPESWSDYCATVDLRIDFGDAIGQIIPRRRDEMIVEDITNEEYDKACKARASIRGAGGFGSTGK